MRELLDAASVSRGLRTVAGRIVERSGGAKDVVLVGVRRGGIPISREIAKWIRELEGIEVPVGTVDITLYRDDAATALPNPRIGPSEIPVAIAGRHVVIVDDVVYTGRTIRAALDAVLDFGRPRRIELAALVDRGGRELPIQPDYVVRTVECSQAERIDVLDEDDGPRAVVMPANAPSPSAPPVSP